MSGIRRYVTSLAALANLTACGGGAGASASSPAVTPPATFATAGALAAKIGCGGYSSSSTEVYVKEGGDCTVGGKTLSVDVFADDKARDSYLTIAKPFGGIYAAGPRWVIHGDDRAAVERAAKAAGGTISE